MNRQDALAVIMTTIQSDDVVIATTGLISREIFEKFDSNRNFYNPGAMGLVSSIGLGLALNIDRRVVVIDGDSSLLMNFGSLVTIGYHQPTNLLHIVIDNESFGSCSEETSMSSAISLSQFARDANYQYTVTVSSEMALKDAIIAARGNLSFINAKIKLGGRRDFARPLNLEAIKTRFMHYLEGGDVE